MVFVFVRSGAPTNQLIPITLFYFGALFGICALLIRQASGGRSTPPRRSNDLPASEDPAYLKPPNTAQLEEGRHQPIGSVTDHTTRTLDEIRVERKQ